MARAEIDSKTLVQQLVAFDTTSRNSNLALIEFVRDYLDDHKVESELVFDEGGGKANLFATIGPVDKGGVMLSGHTDVVPVDDQDWHSDPFHVEERDGRLVGRGTSDMKSFIAVVLKLVPTMVRRRLRTPIHLAFSYDEEVGCIGVRRLITRIAGRPVRPRLCIVGEPTGMQVGIGHKGKLGMRCHVHGFEAHSSLTHLGVNAVETAAELIAFLKQMARRKRDAGPFDPDFTPPYSSIHTGIVRGGTALNIVPKDCHFDFEFRMLPSEDAEALLDELRHFAATRLLPEMQAVHADTDIAFEELSSAPGLNTSPDEEVTRMAMSLTGANATAKVAFATEGGLFQSVGIPTIVCGPGSIDQAHKPDEFIALEQIARCEAFVQRLIDRAARE